MRTARSRGSILLGLLALGLLAAALALPHWQYDETTGRRTPRGGFHDPNDTGVVHHSVTFSPFAYEGDLEPTDAQAASAHLEQLGIALVAAVVLAAVAVLAEVPGFGWMPRWLRLSCLVLAAAAAAAALAIVWFRLPETMSGYRVSGPFTSLKEEDGYFRTTLDYGWVAAALALPSLLGAFLFRYAAGSDEEAMRVTAQAQATQ